MKTIPFPQANNMELIYNLVKTMPEDGVVYSTIAKENKIADRQGAYYLNALLFLELSFKIKNRFFPTEMCLQFKKADINKKEFCDYLINHPKLNVLYTACHSIKDKKQKLDFIRSYIHSNFNLDEGTASRRASTILNWFVWIEKQKEEL